MPADAHSTRLILARLAGANGKTRPEFRTRLGIDHVHPPVHACGQLMRQRQSDTCGRRRRLNEKK